MFTSFFWTVCCIYTTASSMADSYGNDKSNLGTEMNPQQPCAEDSACILTTPSCRICEYNGSHPFVKSNFSWISNPIALNECSLFQLINRSLTSVDLPRHFFQPAHLNCSLFRIVINVNFYKNYYKRNMTMVSILNYNTTNNYTAKVKLELDWMVNVIKALGTTSELLNTIPAIITDDKLILEGCISNAEWILDHVSKRLPDFCLEYIQNCLDGWNLEQYMPDKSTKTSIQIPLNDLLNNPYLLYIQPNSTIHDILNQYDIINEGDKIINEIENTFRNMFNANDYDISEKEVLQSISIILILSTQRKDTPIRFKEQILKLFKLFEIHTNVSNWISLIYKIGETTAYNNVLAAGKKERNLDKFLDYYDLKRNNTSIQLINIFITKIVLCSPFYHVIPLSCLMFHRNLLDNFSTWMTLRYSIFTRVLTGRAIKKESKFCQNYQPSSSTILELKYWGTASFIEFIKDAYTRSYVFHCKSFKYSDHPSYKIEILKQVHNLLINIYYEVETNLQNVQ